MMCQYALLTSKNTIQPEIIVLRIFVTKVYFTQIFLRLCIVQIPLSVTKIHETNNLKAEIFVCMWFSRSRYVPWPLSQVVSGLHIMM